MESSNIPEFYILKAKPRTNVFYVSQPNILPRTLITDHLQSPIPTNTLKTKNFIFVNEKKEEPNSPIKLNNNVVSKVLVDMEGQKYYMKYLAPIEC